MRLPAAAGLAAGCLAGAFFAIASRAVHAQGGDAPAGGQPGTARAGAALYENCLPCHGESGGGIPHVYPALAASPVVLGDPKVLARWVVLGERPANLPAGRYPTRMPAFGWLRAADAAALLTYVRTHFGNAAAPVDAATMTAALAHSAQ